MKTIYVSILCLLACLNVWAQGGEERTAAFQFGFVPPLSTNGTSALRYTNKASVNLLVGVSANETSFTMSGLSTIVSGRVDGFHMAGINNSVGSGRGFLMAGVANTVKNDYKGFQMAGVANVAGDVSGFQLGGLLNIARDVRGVQMAGLLNIARSGDYPIGLINIIADGEIGVGVSYNETGSAILAMRSGGRVLYGILGVGYNHKADKDDIVLQGGLGAHINISDKFRINNELTAATMTRFKKNNLQQYSFAIMPAYRPVKALEIFAGPSINFLYSDNKDNQKVFPNHSLWKKYGEKNKKQLYVGWTVGTQVLF